MGNDVHLALQLRYGTRARYVRSVEIDSWALERAAEARIGRGARGLRDRDPEVRRMAAWSAERLARAGRLDAGARQDLAARLERLGASTWVAAAPHRDVLLLAGEQALEELSKRAGDAVQRAPHPVSASLFAITPQGPRPLQR